jgi:hypothetical protein
MANAIFRVLRLASIAICLIVIASFAVFAIDQTKEGSAHQQQELGSTPVTTGATTGVGHEGSVHKVLTEASNKLTSPFTGIVSSSSEWASRGIKLVFALLVYGFGLGYIARVVRVRV